MNFHSAGLRGMSDALLQKEATRKGVKSISRSTGKPVAKSSTKLTISAPLAAYGVLTGTFDGPPQLADHRVHELARLQIAGFFYFLTYDQESNNGHWWQGEFYPIHGTIKSDWGNPIHRAFMAEVASWDYRLLLTTANGYFRTAIRRHPTSECWSWAVEWNNCYRLVGFFGNLEAAQAVADRLPDLPVQAVVESVDRWARYRPEESLLDHEDTMFGAILEPEA